MILSISNKKAAKTENSAARENTNFVLPTTFEKARDLLRSAFSVETALRNHNYNAARTTESALAAAAKWLTTPGLKPWLIVYSSGPGNGKTTLVKSIGALISNVSAVVDDQTVDAIRRYEDAAFAAEGYWRYGESSAITHADLLAYRELFPELVPAVAERVRQRLNFGGAITLAEAWAWELRNARDAISGQVKRYLQQFGGQNGPAVEYIGAQDLVAIYRREDSEGDLVGENIARTRKADFLIVDDAGAESDQRASRYGNVYYPFVETVYKRYDDCAPMIITTNLSFDGLATFYGARVADRLREMCETIHLKGESFRR